MIKVKLNLTHNDTVAQVILNDGKGNVLDHIMVEELQSLLIGFKKSAQLKLITFEGEGKHFSFGASVEEHRKEFAEAMLRGFHQLFYLLRDLSIPCVAKISGQCLGGGFELAMMCNFIFTDKTAKLGQPEISLGVFPPPASIILPEKIGYAKAEELLITGKSITADEAKSIGLINHLLDDKPGLNTWVDEWISIHVVPKSASSLRFAVKAARVKFNHILSNFLPQLETLYLHQLMQTHDANEGISSFLEKRKPVWDNA